VTSVAPIYPTLEQTGPKEWVSQGEVVWTAQDLSGTVPDKFVTDGASTPKILWNLFPPLGRYSIAAVVHDHLYRTHPFDRKTCDKVFLALMVFLEVSRWRRRSMYRAVRLFGGKPYKSGPSKA